MLSKFFWQFAYSTLRICSETARMLNKRIILSVLMKIMNKLMKIQEFLDENMPKIVTKNKFVLLLGIVGEEPTTKKDKISRIGESYYILEYKMKGQTELEPSTSLFKKGMTLDEYLSEMKPVRHENQTDDDHLEEDLYETSRKVKESMSKKLITYEIRESDEDDYDESNQQRVFNEHQNNLSTRFAYNDHQKSNKNIVFNLGDSEPKNSLGNSRGFRVRRQSNSPFSHLKKEGTSVSPGKNFSRTLQSNEWKIHKEPPAVNLLPSSTLYGKFLKGLKDKQTERPKENSKEKYFKKKNIQEIQYVIKYERDKNSKYSRSQYPEAINMRVEGITDRLVERKFLHGKGKNMK